MKKYISVSLLILLFSSLLQAAPPDIAKTIQKIENRKGTWTHLRASLKINFSVSGKKAACRAELFYGKLDERILLKGFNEKNKLLFVFKTNDRYFELYLPHDDANYHGSIFDLEDSPDIHSHLKALDLYRALKPMSIPEEKTDLLDTGHLKINGSAGDREIFLNNSGDIVKEIYYSAEGKPKTVVERSGFRELKKSKYGVLAFPYRILIQSPSRKKTASQTELIFESTDFEPSQNEQAFEFILPENIRQVDVGQKF